MCRLLVLLCVGLFSLLPGATLATPEKLHWDGPRVGTLSGHGGGHRFTVRVEQANFKTSGRKIAVRKDGMVLLDGRPTFGRDWSPSRDRSEKLDELRTSVTEIVSFRASIDGRAIRISPPLYSDLLNPNLDKGHLTAKLSDDGRAILVDMEGSDGAGSYQVKWKLRPNDKSSRSVTIEEG